MTEFNTATLISFSAVGFFADLWGLTLPFVFLVGLTFYAFTVAKKWKGFNGVSVARFFTERFGKDIGWISAIFLFIAMLGFSSTYVKSLLLIFNPLFPNLDSRVLSGTLVISVVLISLRGGLISIIRTDILSFILILFFIPFLLYSAQSIPTDNSIEISLQQMQEVLPVRYISSLILLTMFSYILAPWYGQKIISAKDKRTAYLGVLCSAFIVFILYSIAVMATSILRRKGVSLDNHDVALPYLIYKALPIGLQGIAYGILFCIGATTLMGVWSAMVTLIVGQFQDYAQTKRIKYGIVFTISCAGLSYLGANLFVDQILKKMILANIPVISLSFALLSGFYWKRTSRIGVYVSMIMGLTWGIYCYIVYGEEGMYTWYWAIFGIPLIFFTGILGSILFPPKTEKDKIANLNTVNGKI